jgi:hypothetical protein
MTILGILDGVIIALDEEIQIDRRLFEEGREQ